MRNIFLLLVFLLFYSISAFAQIQSEPGKILLLDGQVVEGKVTYNYDNPLIINVYDAANNKQTFEPGELDKITLDDGRRFVAKEYSSSSGTSTLIFQEVVVSDNITLYKREIASLEFYISKADKIIKLENNERDLTDKNGKRYKKMDHKYIGTLTMLMKERTDLIEKIQKTEFSEKSLAAIVAAYNNGNVSYYFASEAEIEGEVEKTPYFQGYAHYTNHDSYYYTETSGPSWGTQIGIQYYFSSESRNSLRLGFDISSYEIKDGSHGYYGERRKVIQHKTFSLKYQYDFIKRDKLKFFFLVHILEIGQMQANIHHSKHNFTIERDPDIVHKLRLSPGIGVEYNATEKVSMFAEVNNLFHFEHLPKSFSVGLKYTYRR